jgi:hypothetical protein
MGQGRLSTSVRTDLKRNGVCECGLDLSGPVVGSCELGNELSGPMKGGKFLEQLSD